MGDKNVEWLRGGGSWLVAYVGPVTLLVHPGTSHSPWEVRWEDDIVTDEAPSLPEAKRAAIEAARRVLRESGAMLDALEKASAEPRKGTVGP